MKITPSTKRQKPGYPILLAAAVVTAATLASCQQQQQQQIPMQRPVVLGGCK